MPLASCNVIWLHLILANIHIIDQCLCCCHRHTADHSIAKTCVWCESFDLTFCCFPPIPFCYCCCRLLLSLCVFWLCCFHPFFGKLRCVNRITFILLAALSNGIVCDCPFWFAKFFLTLYSRIYVFCFCFIVFYIINSCGNHGMMSCSFFYTMLSHTACDRKRLYNKHTCVYGAVSMSLRPCLICVAYLDTSVCMCLAHRKDWILNRLLAIACPYQQCIS